MQARELLHQNRLPTALVVDSEDPAAAPADLDALAVDDEESWFEDREDVLLYQ